MLDQLIFLRVCLLWNFLKTNENDIIDILVTEPNLHAEQQIAMKRKKPSHFRKQLSTPELDPRIAGRDAGIPGYSSEHRHYQKADV